jgi:hypothetical protein
LARVRQMLRRLLHISLLLASIAFIFVNCFVYFHPSWRGIGGTNAGHIDFLFALCGVAGAAIALREMGRDSRKGRIQTNPGHAAASGSNSLLSAAAALEMGLVRRPVLMTVVILLIAVPMGLWMLATGRTVREFTDLDWLLTGLAEVPIFTVLVFAIYKYWRARRAR